MKEEHPELAKVKERTKEADAKQKASSRADAIERKYASKADDSEGTQLEKKMQKDLDYRCEGESRCGCFSFCRKYTYIYSTAT